MSRILIVNPFASGVTERKLAAVQAALPAGTETFLTQARGDATDLAAEWSPQVEAIYVFSGDGTYNEVINGMRADVPVGFVPGGGTSVLPRALGLPRNPVHAAQRIGFGKPRRISLGRINGRLFSFNAGIGFDAELVRRVDALGRREDGKRPGDLTFGLTVLQGARRQPLPLRGGARGGGARPRRVRADRQLLARTRTPGASASASCPNASFEGGLDIVAPRRGAAARGFRGSPRRRCGDGPGPGSALLGHDLDRIVIRCDAAPAGPGRRRGHRRRRGGGDRRDQRRADRA